MQILKLDHFAGLHRASLQEGTDPQPLLPGAPNFRRLPGDSIYGLSQPSLDGLERVLARIGQPVLWVNLREEPVLYVDGQPFSLREADYPYLNEEDPGIMGDQLEEFEAGLRQEMLARGRFDVCSENGDKSLVHRWVEADPERVLTVRQAFERHPQVRLVRIPVSDERAPEVQDFDALLRVLRTHPQGPTVFNCQAGQGRTTTGMVIADLVRQAGQGRLQPRDVDTSLWEAVSTLPTTRAEADAAIVRSNQLVDLRDSILHPAVPPQGHHASVQEAMVERVRDYLRRYYLLVAFTRYLEADVSFTFATWLHDHPVFLHSLQLLGRSLGLAETA